jgi:hypothetical protein
MIVPEQRHLLFKRAAGVHHPREPPSLKLATIETGKVKRIGEIKTASEQIIQRAIIDLFIIDEGVDGAFPSEGANLFKLGGATGKAHSPQEVRAFVVCHTRHPTSHEHLRINDIWFPLCRRHPLVGWE